MRKAISLGILILTFAGSLSARPAAADLLKKIEDNYHQSTDVRARVGLTQQKTNQGVKNIEMMYYRRDRDNAFLIVMTGPEAEKGNGYLRMDDNFWMYRRNTRTFQHINRDENIGGSDAHGDDFESRNLTEMYQPVKDSAGGDGITEEKLGQIPVFRFEVKAIVNDVSYPKKIYWVRQDNALVLKEASYSLSNTLMQTAYYLKYAPINGKFVPVQQMFIDEFEKGNKTIMELSNISTEKLAETIFTKAYLENLSK
jgi:hypothetical protein